MRISRYPDKRNSGSNIWFLLSLQALQGWNHIRENCTAQFPQRMMEGVAAFVKLGERFASLTRLNRRQ